MTMNDRVKVIDPKEPKHGQEGRVMYVKGMYYYVEFADREQVRFREPQIEKL